MVKQHDRQPLQRGNSRTIRSEQQTPITIIITVTWDQDHRSCFSYAPSHINNVSSLLWRLGSFEKYGSFQMCGYKTGQRLTMVETLLHHVQGNMSEIMLSVTITGHLITIRQ